MDELSIPVVEALKAAGSNPLALAAFALLVGAMLVVALKVRRNKNLLESLEKLPEKDRLQALKLEMGAPRIKGGLSPEQWLRQNSRMYLLGGLVVLCVTVVVLASLFVSSMREKAQPSGVRIELLPEPPPPAPAAPSSAVRGAVVVPHLHAVAQSDGTPASTADTLQVTGSYGPEQIAEQKVPEQRVVVYQATLDKGVSRIKYSAPYLDLVQAGGPIEGFNNLGVPFRWRFPRLSVTVANNTSGVMVLSEARIEVLEAQPVNDVVLLVEDLPVERLVFRNEGWSDVVAPAVEFTVTDVQRDGDVSLFAPTPVVVELPTCSDRCEVALATHIPAALKNRDVVQVQGSIAYGAPTSRKTVRFKTRVSMQVRAAVGMPPTYTYDVLLNANQPRVIKQIGLAQKIPAGDSDHFALRLASDRTARYRLRMDFVTAGGTVMKGAEAWVEIFVPRTRAQFIQGG